MHWQSISQNQIENYQKYIKVNFDDYFSRTDCKRNQIIHLDSGFTSYTM